MNYNPEFSFDTENGLAVCVIKNKTGTRVYKGIAQCHPNDEDMMNAKTGYQIAFFRARIKMLQGKRDEARTELKALRHLESILAQSKKTVDDEYCMKTLRRQIAIAQMDVETTVELIDFVREDMRAYINEKDIFYKRIRAKRELEAKAD